jgi:acyl-CoA hydrolase
MCGPADRRTLAWCNVWVQARLIYIEAIRMYIAVCVRSSNPQDGHMALTTYCLIIFVAVGEMGHLYS